MLPRRDGIKVAVVGAGVIGLSSAYHLVKRFPHTVTVTVIAEKFSPNTTSDIAGGFIQPIDFHSSPSGVDDRTEEVRIQRWTEDTFRHLHPLYQSKAAPLQLGLVSGYRFVRDSLSLPWWKDLVFGFRCFPANSPELQTLTMHQSSHRSQSVWAFSTYMLDCRHYLPWLMDEFIKSGGTIEQRRLSSLDELRHYYDVIVNCSGLGAVELVGDGEVCPYRGQVVLVRAPWIKHFVIVDSEEGDENMVYILPRSNMVFLGGTAQVGNWSESVDPTTSEAIVSRCTTVLPALCGAEVVGAWVGGRPVRRGAVRFEAEEKRDGSQLLIHNYGHGGQGVTLHWGCALEVGRMVEMFVTSARARL